MLDITLRAAQRACRAGLDSVTLRRELAELVAPALGAATWAFSTCDPDTGFMTHTVAEGVQAALARRYVEELYPHDVARLTTDLPRRGVPVFSVPEHSPYTAVALREHRVHEQINVCLVARGRLWGTWCLMWDFRSSTPSASRQTFLRRLAPEVARALRDAVKVDHARAAGGIESESVPGVVVLDDRGRVVTRTPAARRWLDDLSDDGFALEGGVPLAVFSLATQLRATRSAVADTARMRVVGRSGRRYAISAALAEPGCDGRRAATVIVEPLVRRAAPATLGSSYGLSAREREVVAAVVRGEPTKCIAAELGISPYTVSEHLDRACAKLGVRGRKALVARLFVDERAS